MSGLSKGHFIKRAVIKRAEWRFICNSLLFVVESVNATVESMGGRVVPTLLRKHPIYIQVRSVI